MTDARDELANLIRDTVHAGTRRVSWEDIADAIIAAGWRAPLPPCAHRFVIFGGQCGECGQMPPPPTKEDLGLLRTALARAARDNGNRIGLDELAQELGVDLAD